MNTEVNQRDHPNPGTRANLPLVTLDNNVLIALQKDEPEAPFVEQLLRLNYQHRIVIIVTVSTMLERQPDGQDIDIQQFETRLRGLGIAPRANA